MKQSEYLKLNLSDATDVFDHEVFLRENFEKLDEHVSSHASQLAQRMNLYLDVKNPPAPLISAKGDGVTDDTEAIQSILDYGAENGYMGVYFPKGTYIIQAKDPATMTTSAIVLDSKHKGMRLFGSGFSSIIKATNNGVTTWFNMVSLTNTKDIIIENLAFDGNADANFSTSPPIAVNGYHCIVLQPTTNGVVDNILIDKCYFRGSFDSAIQSRHLTQPYPFVTRIRIVNCTIETTGAHGVGMGYFKESLVSNCTFKNVGRKPILQDGFGSGMAVDVSAGCEDIAISHNIIEGSGYAGLKAETHEVEGVKYSAKNVIFDGNVITNIDYQVSPSVTQYAIRVNGQQIKVINNIVNGYYGRGVDMGADALKCEIANNTFLNGQASANGNGEGISVAGSGEHLITNNTIDVCKNSGVYCASPKTTIAQNKISNATLDGIRVSAVSDVIVTGNKVEKNPSGSGVNVLTGASKLSITNNQLNNNSRGVSIPVGVDVELQSNQCYGNTASDYSVYGHFISKIENGRKYLYYTGIPASGTWSVGDIVYNTNPIAGGYTGWVCVGAGTPGTWKGFGLIQA